MKKNIGSTCDSFLREEKILAAVEAKALEETAYLLKRLKSPRNAQRLLHAITDLESNKNNKKHGLNDVKV